jgi:superfamily I DNA and RNA helicase
VTCRNALVSQLNELLAELLEEGANADEIGIVLPLDGTGEFIQDLLPRFRKRLIPLDVQTVRAQLRGKIVWGAVDRFKGLERPIILCVGFDSTQFANERVAELYVAATRANYGLFLFVGPEAARAIRANEARFADALLAGEQSR